MSKSIEEMYAELMSSSNLDIISSSGKEYFDDEDGEDFLTSKEIVKQKEILEEKLGITQPSAPVYSEIEESVYFKRYNKRRVHKYTEQEMEEIRKSCELTIVHDYGEYDIYHMSDEERANNDMLAELNMKLAGIKRTYRKIDQYIEAMRVVIQAWELLERNNYIHDKDEFFQLVSEGKIVSNRIIMPKMKKLDQYNMDLIIKYISNPELDPHDLVPEKNKDQWSDWEDDSKDAAYTEYYNSYLNDHVDEYGGDINDYELREAACDYAEDMLVQDDMERLLSPAEAQAIIDLSDNPPEFEVKDINPKLIKGYDKRNFYSFEKKKKKEDKTTKYIKEGLHELLLKIQTNPQFNNDGYSSSFMLTNSMFEPEKKEKNFYDENPFRGSWADDEAVFLYDIYLREQMMLQHPPKESYVTYGDKELSRFFSILEENGINTVDLRRKMNMTEQASSKKQILKEKKANKKVESQLLQRITKLNENKKFKKIVNKAEKEVAKYSSEY